jgi:hypothetical protein
MSTILGIFDNRFDAESAVADLEIKGYAIDDMSIVLKEDQVLETREGSKGGAAAAGAVSGATTGGVIGGLAGLLIGIGAVAIPGVGALLIGGPLAAALGLTGAAATTLTGAATGALAGGLIGGLIALGVPEDAAEVYEQRVREGAVLLAVPAADTRDEDEVRNVFESYNADEVRTVADLRSNVD